MRVGIMGWEWAGSLLWRTSWGESGHHGGEWAGPLLCGGHHGVRVGIMGGEWAGPLLRGGHHWVRVDIMGESGLVPSYVEDIMRWEWAGFEDQLTVHLQYMQDMQCFL